MEQYNVNLPSKEFVESNFNKIMAELAQLKEKNNSPRIEDKKYYRSKDLKRIFGLSDNTISDYRNKGIIPFTKLGEIYYYPVVQIEEILRSNSNFGKISNH